MRLAALVSGGKDSIAALWLAKQRGHEIKYIIAVQPQSAESYMFHYPNIKLVKVQAEALGIPLIEIKTSGKKEEELKDLEDVLVKIKDEIDGVISGALASEYQKSRVDKLCKKYWLDHLAPLWHMDADEHWKQLLDNKFEIMITAVAAAGLDDRWLGKIIDENNLEELRRLSKKHGFSLVGEGGEYESFVLDMPLFKKRIVVTDSRKNWVEKEQNGLFIIKKVRLTLK